MTILAYQGSETKQSVLDRLAEHARLDQIVKGTYWFGGKGCAVGCLTHVDSGGHGQFPARWGIPVQVAYLIDRIFEALPTVDAMVWPARVMGAIPEGADLSRVWDRFAAWMLHDLESRAGVDPCVGVMAGLFDRAVAGDEPSDAEWAEAAWAAWAAWAAEARTAWAAWAAWAAQAAEAAQAAQAADMLVEILTTSPVPEVAAA